MLVAALFQELIGILVLSCMEGGQRDSRDHWKVLIASQLADCANY
jgi:hypothetical protein